MLYIGSNDENPDRHSAGWCIAVSTNIQTRAAKEK